MTFSVRALRPDILLVAVFLLASWLCFQHQPLGCRYCDTRGYLDMGAAYAKAGGISEVIMTNEQTGEPFEASKLRLYGYPLFIAGLVKIGEFTGIDRSILVFAAQLALYLAGAVWLAAILGRHVSPRIGQIALAGLLLNPLVYPYFGTPLSDSLSVALEVLLFALLATLFFQGTADTASRARRLGGIAFIGLLTGALLGYALMLRPGNLYLLAFGGLALPAVALLRRQPLLLLALPAAGLGFLAAVAPQIAFNWQHYGQFSFMPVSELGKFQIDAGKSLLKYATWTKAGGQGIYYASPWAVGTETGLPWYLHHRLAGLKTIAMHVFGMLDFEYYSPYVDKVKPRHEFLLLLISQGLVFWAVWGWLRLAGEWLRQRPALPALLLPVVFSACWLMIYSLTAGENRFALPLIVLAGPWALWALARQPDRWQWEGMAGFLVWLGLAHHAAGLLDGLRSVAAG
jgi:hypothetical protein